LVLALLCVKHTPVKDFTLTPDFFAPPIENFTTAGPPLPVFGSIVFMFKFSLVVEVEDSLSVFTSA